MLSSRRFWRAFASLAVSGGLAVAQSNQPAPPTEEPASWLEPIWNLPVFRWFTLFEPPSPPVTASVPQPPPCRVKPLPSLIDLEALDFEASAGSAEVVKTDGLTPATSRALSRFEGLVTSAGGAMRLTSAFRPAAYQDHLQAVWDKWMVELRNNQDSACAVLKAQVLDEFTRHQLLSTQRPVPFSDHTLGIGFDAAVQLPAFARRARRRRVSLSLDRLARLSGVLRPDIRRDPVHFRLIGGRG